MRTVLTLACLGFVSMAARGDVVTNATCAAYSYGAVSAALECQQGSGNAYGAGPEAHASASAMASLPPAANAFATATLSEYVSEVPALISNSTGPSSASASAAIHLNLSTGGPVRTGLLEIDFSTLSWIDAPDGYSGQMSLAIGSLTGSCQSTGHAVCALNGSYVESGSILYLPFTLGEAFAFDFAQNSSVNGDLLSGASEARDQTGIGFRFFEADGSTPVGMYDPPAAAPEPATWGIVALGVLAFALSRTIRSVRRPAPAA